MTHPQAWHVFRNAVDAAWPVTRYGDLGVVVGCSGGADSVALVRGLVESIRSANDNPCPGFIVLAHFNHGFRGQESDGDESFVRELAFELEIPIEVERGSGAHRDEASARQDRRSFFRNVIRRYGARYLALGHSLDDNVETVLYRLMRGTGPTGIAGIAPFRPFSDCERDRDFVIARPLLRIGRDLIRQALLQQGYSWREDGSNRSNAYRRNWIRNELLPSIQAQFPDAVPAIARAIDGQRQWLRMIEGQVERWLQIVRIRSQPLTLRRLDRICPRRPSGPTQNQTPSSKVSPIDQLDRDGDAVDLLVPAVAIEALRRCWHESEWPLRDMSQAHWQRILEILKGDGPDRFTLPGSICVSRDSGSITIRRPPNACVVD